MNLVLFIMNHILSGKIYFFHLRIGCEGGNSIMGRVMLGLKLSSGLSKTSVSELKNLTKGHKIVY